MKFRPLAGSQFCDIKHMWAFKHYVASNGTTPFKNWYDGLSDSAQAKLDSKMEYLAQQPRNGWCLPDFRVLHSPCKGLSEIRFKDNRVQYRPLGFFGPGASEFTLLAGATEKGGSLKPRGICDTALQYKENICTHGGKVDDWDPERETDCKAPS